MEITNIEITVIQMTLLEENALWKEWQQHYQNGKDVVVCGHTIKDWDTNDGNNCLWLKDQDGNERWLSIHRKN